jgi:hypothetical protein
MLNFHWRMEMGRPITVSEMRQENCCFRYSTAVMAKVSVRINYKTKKSIK